MLPSADPSKRTWKNPNIAQATEWIAWARTMSSNVSVLSHRAVSSFQQVAYIHLDRSLDVILNARPRAAINSVRLYFPLCPQVRFDLKTCDVFRTSRLLSKRAMFSGRVAKRVGDHGRLRGAGVAAGTPRVVLHAGLTPSIARQSSTAPKIDWTNFSNTSTYFFLAAV